MYQSDRGNYRTNESVMHSFMNSCLGRIVIFAGACLILALIAAMSIPDEETMTLETLDNVCQSIESNDSIKSDKIDTFVDNVNFSFTHIDSTFDAKKLKTFHKYNRIDQSRGAFYATTDIVNNMYPEGQLAGIGIFGMVISTISYSDLLLYIDKMRGDFNQRIIKQGAIDEDYYGETPNVKPFHYEGDPSQ